MTSLSSKELLQKVPRFGPRGYGRNRFFRELEALCGREAEAALQSSFGPHVIDPVRVTNMLPSDGDAMPCLIAAASVPGWDLAFSGNEASPDRDDLAALPIPPSLSGIAGPR